MNQFNGGHQAPPGNFNQAPYQQGGYNPSYPQNGQVMMGQPQQAPQNRGDFSKNGSIARLVIAVALLIFGIMFFGNEVRPEDEVLINAMFEAGLGSEATRAMLKASFLEGALGKLCSIIAFIIAVKISIEGLLNRRISFFGRR